MLILGQRNNDSLAREFDWFGSSERLEISPASIWVPDEDETLRRRVRADNASIVEENSGDEWSLHEISPQVSVGDEDSLAQPSALPEIKPHLSVRDEDSFAKPRPLPEINPHVSVRDDDTLAEPSALPEISPHVSVRDEDSFAKPSALPEINPHVSVRDEDSFAKPRPLPEINPHVSVRDEDSLAQPSALPEIHPQISILDESHASASANEAAWTEVCAQLIAQDMSLQASPEFDSEACGIDKSKALPGEPTFVTLTLDGQNEKRFVQEYRELRSNQPVELSTGNPAEVVSSNLPELESNHPTELGSSGPTELESRRPLTELRSSHRNQLESPPPTESEPNRPTELESRRPIVIPLVRVLDESQVLPDEASFATAIPDGPSAPGTHSPLEEFLAKTNMDLRTFGLATLLFISIIGVSALVIMEATTGIFSSQLVAGATANPPSPSAEAVLPQSEALSTTKPITVTPLAGSKPSKQSMAPLREYSKFPGEVTKRTSLEGSRSDLSRKANSNDVRAEKADKKPAVKSESRDVVRESDKHAAPAKGLRANMKESGARKKVAESRHSTSSQKKTEGRKTSSTNTTRKPASASAKDATIVKPKVETKVPSASNGAQRPRTVTQRKTS